MEPSEILVRVSQIWMSLLLALYHNDTVRYFVIEVVDFEVWIGALTYDPSKCQ